MLLFSCGDLQKYLIMATSKITLYKKCKINRTKNMIVDNLDSYLLTLESYTYEMQYQKTALKLNLKLNLDQKYAQAITPMVKNRTLLFEASYNYVKIENTNTAPDTILYYFIDKINWKGTTCVELELTLDVLNTYRFDENQTAAYKIGSLSNQTHITREHKDRYNSLDKRAIIDEVDEGINPPLYRQSKTNICDVDFDHDCYLIYKNKNTPQADNYENPVECYVCFDDAVTFENKYVANSFSADDFQEGKIYTLVNFMNDSGVSTWFTFTDSNGNAYVINTARNYFRVYFVIQAGRIIYFVTQNVFDSATTLVEKLTNYGKSCDYFVLSDFKTSSGSITIDYCFIPSKSFNVDESAAWSIDRYALKTGTTLSTSAFNEIDRTDSKLIKIIKLPYRVFDVMEGSNNAYIIPSGWNLVKVEIGDKYNILLKLVDLNTSLQVDITGDIDNPIYEDLYYLGANAGITFELDEDNKYKIDKTKERSTYEPKLLNSAFYTTKYFYDSFGYTINYEDLDLSKEFDDIFRFTFLSTSTINSKFLFDLDYSYTKSSSGSKVYNVPLKRTSQDYSLIIPVARNNEMPLYNVAYINYIRTGYNYDVKKMERQNTANWVILGISTAAAVIGTIAGGPVGGAAVAAGVGGVATAIYNNIRSQTEAEQTLAQKQDQLRAQASSVSGSDDVDLMSYYNQNALQCCKYKCSDIMKKLLLDLFYFTGYKSNRFSNDLHVNSRAWFNFIQADLVFDNVTLGTPKECLDELIAQYKNGVTYFHMNNIDSTQTWDFEQTKENAETFVYDN